MPPIARPGDVLEIRTAKGFAYAVISHIHPAHGALLRVLRGFRRDRPATWDWVALAPLQLSVFCYPTAVFAGNEIVVAHRGAVPASLSAWPQFKAVKPGATGAAAGVAAVVDLEEEKSIPGAEAGPDAMSLPTLETTDPALIVAYVEEEFSDADVGVRWPDSLS
ncbi:MAG: hypothetical protein JNJ88_16995 [Planctomycetes bacterium]|nr:hypothetical protein [Planctomycetota bacterium]